MPVNISNRTQNTLLKPTRFYTLDHQRVNNLSFFYTRPPRTKILISPLLQTTRDEDINSQLLQTTKEVQVLNIYFFIFFCCLKFDFLVLTVWRNKVISICILEKPQQEPIEGELFTASLFFRNNKEIFCKQPSFHFCFPLN